MSIDKGQYCRNVMEAYKKVDRKSFVTKTSKGMCINDNLPIGFGQNITQTKIVVDMLTKCKINKTHKVLEIGTGSGYQTLLLSLLSREVYTIERVKELSIAAQKRILLFGADNVHYLVGDGTYGWKENCPYDRIVVSACCTAVPHFLFEQLGINGIMIIPVGGKKEQKLMRYLKFEDGTIAQEMLYDVNFVEFKGEEGWE